METLPVTPARLERASLTRSGRKGPILSPFLRAILPALILVSILFLRGGVGECIFNSPNRDAAPYLPSPSIPPPPLATPRPRGMELSVRSGTKSQLALGPILSPLHRSPHVPPPAMRIPAPARGWGCGLRKGHRAPPAAREGNISYMCRMKTPPTVHNVLSYTLQINEILLKSS